MSPFGIGLLHARIWVIRIYYFWWNFKDLPVYIYEEGLLRTLNHAVFFKSFWNYGRHLQFTRIVLVIVIVIIIIIIIIIVIIIVIVIVIVIIVVAVVIIIVIILIIMGILFQWILYKDQ